MPISIASCVFVGGRPAKSNYSTWVEHLLYGRPTVKGLRGPATTIPRSVPAPGTKLRRAASLDDSATITAL